MKHFNWTNIRLVLMFGAILFMFSFTAKRNNLRKLTKTKIVFVGDNAPFINQAAVNKLLIENHNNVKSMSKHDIDLNKLEKTLNAHAMIEKSELFLSIDGAMTAIVKQKTPVARILDRVESYYIDYKGSNMPLSQNYTARVPLVSGIKYNKDKQKLGEVLRLIYDDEFLKKNIIGIQIMPNGSLNMVSRNYDYKINFGQTIRMNAKFNNYKVFFQKAVLDSSLYKYKTIDLRFAQQVVCTKI